ncbi:hypothetical protein ILUMI_21261 [Ignelater luminosus]|uniref:Uncharacterized protein n=1 Tax=Ignelater luminosus TaxID=2038154 RepID=A0A8K0CJ64_IGNLU|nr:hypothetical protein ILUMI_21261 [Ignelater luminosus]
MGCSAAKNLTVEPLDGTKVTQLSNGVEIPRKLSTPRKASDVPPLEGVDPQTEFLESASHVNNVHQTTHGLSFDIPFQEEDGESIIRKHPPKRFQKLEDQQTSPTLSLVRLQEKLDDAEIRRQQILQNRVQSAQFRKVLKKQSTVYSINEDDTNHLQVPQDKPNTPFITSSNGVDNHNTIQ